MTAVTRLGWDVHTTSAGLKSLSWITGVVRPGDAYTVLDYLCRRFNAEVEAITKGHSWGWSYREVRGSTAISEHAAGTAIDLNAPAHPLGKSGTFNATKVKAIHAILATPALKGCIRWGGDYAGRKDEMHFELQGGAANLAKAAKAVGGSSGTKVASTAAKASKKAAKTAIPHMVSPFEGRLTYGWHGYPNHAGMDIAPPIPGTVGRPVYAAFAGTVIRTYSAAKHGDTASTWAPNRTGNGILVENPDGEAQGYNHTRPVVKVGQKVQQGDLLGYGDTSGNQTGPHLHFECWGDADNPNSDYDPQLCFDKYGVIVGSKPALTEQKAAKAATSTTPQEDPDMKIVASLSRTKAVTIKAGKTKTMPLTDKDAISLMAITKGQQFAADSIVHIKGLPGDEAVSLQFVVVDYHKGDTTKVVKRYPLERVIGASGVSLVTGHPLVTSTVPWKVASGHSLRVRLMITNHSGRDISISGVRSVGERN